MSLSKECLTNIVVLFLFIENKPVTENELLYTLYILGKCGILQDISKVVCSE